MDTTYSMSKLVFYSCCGLYCTVHKKMKFSAVLDVTYSMNGFVKYVHHNEGLLFSVVSNFSSQVRITWQSFFLENLATRN